MGNYTRNGYHSGHPGWRNHGTLEGRFIGIEFEVEAHGGSYSRICELLPDFDDPRPLVERDGSLSDSSGCEIIFPPLSLASLRSKNNMFHESVRALSGHTRHTTNTGMHMNINCRTWNTRKIGLFIALVHNLPRASLEILGGRRLNGYCEQIPNQPLADYAGFTSTHGRAIERSGRYRLEMRFPRSTVDERQIDVLIDFIDKAETFVEKFVPENWEPTREKKAIGKSYYYNEPIYETKTDYSELNEQFRAYLKKSKVGRRLLRVMENGLENGYPEPKATKRRTRTADRTGSIAREAA